MTTFTAYPCNPQGEIVECDPNSPFIRVEQTSGETYMGERSFVIHRDEIDTLVATLKGAR